jgi:hypothetical protein
MPSRRQDWFHVLLQEKKIEQYKQACGDHLARFDCDLGAVGKQQRRAGMRAKGRAAAEA